MNRIYLGIPLCAVLAFGAYYWNFDRGYDAEIAARREAEVAEQKTRSAREVEARAKAVKDAVAAAETRKRETLEKERLEEAQKTARADAEEKRAVAFEQRKKFREQVERLAKELDTVKVELTRLEEQKKQLLLEKTFLSEYVRKAEGNVQSYYDLLTKLETAEKARAAAPVPAPAPARKG
jgi:hypothetical protein